MTAAEQALGERTPHDLIAAIRGALADARAARKAAKEAGSLAIADGYWEVFDRAATLIVDALAEAEDGLMLAEAERMFATIDGRFDHAR